MCVCVCVCVCLCVSVCFGPFVVSTRERRHSIYNHSITSLRWFTSKQPKHGLTQELSFSLELEISRR